MTEAELLKEVGSLCEKYHLLWCHYPDSRTMQGRKGSPDLTIVGKYVLFAELKTNWGQMSETQTTWRYRLQAAGAKHVIWKPQDLQDGTIEALLKEMSTRVE